MRKIWLPFMLLLTALLLSACAAQASRPVSFMVFGEPAELKAYQTLVNAFQQKHPEIPVELIHVPAQGDYLTRLSADLAAGTPANIVLLNYRRYAGFAQKGVLEPLQPYLDKSTLIKVDDFYAEAIRSYRWGNQVMCLPQNISSLVVYYNKNMFDAAGVPYPQSDWTWDDFLSAAQSLTKPTSDQYGVGVEPSLIRVAPFIWQNGGELVAIPRASGLLVDSPEAREAIQWFADLQVKHHVAPDAVAEKAEDSESRFSNGRLGMYLDSRKVVPTFRTITDFDWDVAPLPTGNSPATILHSDAYCMTAATKDKDAAWKFIEFANAVEGQQIIVGTGRTVPSLKSVAESDAFLDPDAKPKNSRVWLDVIPTIRAVPILNNWADIEDTANAELERAFYGTASVDEVIKAMVDRTAIFFSETK
jgi:multiple sugar transport system substrate-binding protein